jgi:Ca2+-binding RTX toxin-like protein
MAPRVLVATALLLVALAAVGAAPSSAATLECNHWRGPGGTVSSPTSGDWNVAANWSGTVVSGNPNAHIPTTSEAACIKGAGTYTVSITDRMMFSNFGATTEELDLGAPGTGVGTQTIEVVGATNAARLFLSNGGAIGANGRILLGSLSGTAASICAGPGLTNSGTIQSEGVAGTDRFIQGTLNNQGVVNVNEDLEIPAATSCGENILNNSGSINIAPSKVLNDFYKFNQTAGTTSVGTGSFNFTSGHAFSFSGGSFTGNAPVVTGTGALTVAGGTGTLKLRGSNTLAQQTIPSTIELLVEATATDAILTGPSAAWTNDGTIRLTDAAGATASSDATLVANGVLTNTATIETTGTVGNRKFFNTMVNQDAIAINANTTGSPGGCGCNLNLTNMTGGTIAVATGKSFETGNTFSQTGGTTAVNGSMASIGVFSITGGTFTGNAPILTNPNTLTASGGSGTLRIRGNATMAQANIGPNITLIVESTATNGTLTGPGAPWTNNGTIRLTDVAGATASNETYLSSGGGALTNGATGTIETTGTVGLRTLYGTMTNAGAITMGIDTTGAPGGCGCNLNLTNTTGGAITVASGKSFATGNTFSQSGGTTTVNGSMASIGVFSITGGTFTGNAPILSSPNTLTASGGSGTLRIRGSATMAQANVGPSITLIVETTAANAQLNGPGGAWINNGTIRLTDTTGATAGSDVFLSTGGGMTNSATGTIETAGSLGTRRFFFPITNAGTIAINATTDAHASVGNLPNSGTVTVASGKTFTHGSTFSQSAGTTTVQGSLVVQGIAITISGGTLRGSGTITGNVSNSGGTVAPGTSPGNLTLTGNYTQGSGGTLATEISGTTVGSGYDRLTVSGTATLAGTLAITTPSFAVSPGQNFQVVASTGATSGTFGTVTGGAAFTPEYSATGVNLKVTDADTDGVPDSTDNCQTAANANQANNDNDAQGDACDADDDNDGVPDTSDQCQTTAGAGADGCPVSAPPDGDGDGVPDATDVCPTVKATTGSGCPFGATNGDDTLNGDALANTICGLLGNDTVNGSAGNDILFGGLCNVKAKLVAAQAGVDGNDKLNGNDGNDQLYGAAGKDTLRGGRGNDKLYGGTGNDTLSGDAGKDLLDGGAGNDKMNGGADVNTYKGGAGDDTVSARNRKKDTIDCGAGKKDKATVDRIDKVKGCEKVARAK